MSKILCLHTGLGDFINYSSMISQLAEKELVIIPLINMAGRFPFPEQKKKNILSFFKGVNVKFLDWKLDTDVFDFIEKWEGTGVGWFSKRNCTSKDFNISDHIKEAYEKLGCDYSKLQESPILNNARKIKQLPVPAEPYAFIPEGGSTNKFRIDRKYVTSGLKEVIPPQDAFMLEWADVIYHADEIHIHDTSWAWLVNILPTSGKLYFHKSVRNESNYAYSEIRKNFVTL